MAAKRASDFLAAVDRDILLEVIDASCMYPKTLTIKEDGQHALVEETYEDSDSFGAAIDRAKHDPTIKRMGFSSSIPITMDGLLVLYDACLIGNVDSVLIHHGGATIVRFTNNNTERRPSPLSCSLYISVTEVRMNAMVAMRRVKEFAADHTIAYIVGAVVALVGAVAAGVLSSRRG